MGRRAPSCCAGLLVLAVLAVFLPATATAQPSWLGRAPAAAPAAPGAASPDAPLWPPLSPGAVMVTNGTEFLQALQDNVGDITLAADRVTLSPADWEAFELPIRIRSNASVLVHSADDSGINVRPRTLDWGAAQNLIVVEEGATLALDDLISTNPGNFTLGDTTMVLKNNGSFIWPTVVALNNSSIVISDSTIFHDDPRCSPETVEAAMGRLTQLIPGSKYLGGKRAYYPLLELRAGAPFPLTLPVYNMSLGRAVGSASSTWQNVITECFSSMEPKAADGGSSGGSDSSASGSSTDSGGGGTPTWVWAVVGSVAGCLALAAVGGAFLWRRRRSQAVQAGEGKAGNNSGSSGARGYDAPGPQPLKTISSELPYGPEGGAHNGPASGASNGTADGSGLGSGPGSGPGTKGSGELQSQLLRARLVPVDGVQLGELLGRGAFGRVYRGRWRGVVVAVKVSDHAVRPGHTQDLSREPLLSMSVSHPNVVQTYRMSVVRLVRDEAAAAQATAEEDGSQHGGSGAGASSGSGSGGAGSGGRKRVPAFDGTGMVEIVEPSEVLLPGNYQTWIVAEYCDRGSLHSLLSGGRWGGGDASQRYVWALLCLLDISMGLDYLHLAAIVHGDLKPANVMLKTARNDRRGFVCKLGDFGLSRMLGHDESHVDTQSYGTASYAAPELLLHGKLSAAADIYSLGIVMWELASSGQELHPGLTAMQVILQVTQTGLRPTIADDCPPALAELMQRCWHSAPAQRPSAADVVESLRSQLQALRGAMSPPPAAAPQAQA